MSSYRLSKAICNISEKQWGKPAALLHFQLLEWTTAVSKFFNICLPTFTVILASGMAEHALPAHTLWSPLQNSCLEISESTRPWPRAISCSATCPLLIHVYLLQNPFGFSEKVVQGNSEQDSTKLHKLPAGGQCCLSMLLGLGWEQTSEPLFHSLSFSPFLPTSPPPLQLLPHLAPALCSPIAKGHMIATASHWVFPRGTYFLV